MEKLNKDQIESIARQIAVNKKTLIDKEDLSVMDEVRLLKLTVNERFILNNHYRIWKKHLL